METPTIIETPRTLHPENERPFGKIGRAAIVAARQQAAWKNFGTLGFDAYRAWTLDNPTLRPVVCHEV